MNQVVTTQKNSLSIINDEKKMQLLKDVFFKGATNEEFQFFAHACERTGLDPFMKQIYPVKRWDSTLKREAMTIQTGIDGYRLIAERTGCYSPGRESTFTYDKNGKILSATAYVKKLTKDGTWHEISTTAYFEEYCQRTKDGSPTSMWQKMPHSQLAKCAEALALRKAFPAELSGVYTKEEMEQGDVVEIKTASDIPQTLSPMQCSELQLIFDECEKGYMERILSHVKVKALDQVPSNLFDRIKTAALAKRDEFKAKMTGDDVEYADEVIHA